MMEEHKIKSIKQFPFATLYFYDAITFFIF